MGTADLEIATPLTLPCGLTLPNRLVKSAMAEGWSDGNRLPAPGLVRTYGAWADGGWGMLITSNVQVDPRHLGTRDDNAVNIGGPGVSGGVPRGQALAAWAGWARAAGRGGAAVVMQLNHPGRQSTVGAGSRCLLAKSVAPSAVPLSLGPGLLPRAAAAVVFGTPRAMTADDMADAVARFAAAARLAADAGFAGVQVHAAHGYLLAQFLSARSNRRTDAYGGSPRNRARIVVDVVGAIRRAVPDKGFCVGVKLNSVDHQSENELAECIEQLEDITAAGVDFLEISGGTYEDPRMILSSTDRDAPQTGPQTGPETGPQTADAPRPASTAAPEPVSTAAREAFFLDFARAIRYRFADVPLVVTGGFRSRRGMESAVREGACDMVGIARPAVLDAALPNNIVFNADVADDAARLPETTVAATGIAKRLGMKSIAGGAETLWYQRKIHSMV